MSRNRLTQRRRWLFLLLGVLLTLTTRARAVEVQTTTTTSAKQQRHTQADGSSTSSSSMNPQKSTVLTPESIHQNVYHSFWTRMGAEKEEETGKLNDNFLRLLSTTSDEEKQSFSFTWRDWIGLVVWFCAAGVGRCKEIMMNLCCLSLDVCSHISVSFFFLKKQLRVASGEEAFTCRWVFCG